MIINLSAAPTAQQVKTYFDIASYRNVLDMINTFAGALTKYGNIIRNRGITFLHPAYDPGYGVDQPFAPTGWASYAGPANAFAISHGTRAGYNGNASANAYLYDKLAAVGFHYPTNYRIGTYPGRGSLNPIPVGNFRPDDLINLARSLTYELNRLRLPLPANFRQLIDKIPRRIQQTAFTTAEYMVFVETVDAYGSLKKTISLLQTSVRKEIDAANLAKKVQEATLRQEQDAILSRQKIAAQAKAKAIKIQADKKAAMEAEIKNAAKTKQKLDTAQAKLKQQALILARAQSTQPANKTISVKKQVVIDKINKIEQFKVDKKQSLDVAVKALHNITHEINPVSGSSGIIPVTGQPKKLKLNPFWITVAAGVLLR